MSEALLTVKDLRVDYEKITAVYNVSFELKAGMIYGLIGPNGAGKTSVIRAVANILEPTYSEIHITGFNLAEQPRDALRYLGYMPDFPPIYDDLTPRQFLAMFASAYGIPASERTAKINALLKQVSLLNRADEPCGGMSRGMRQRLFLAKTLINDPKVLLLDEPASGLDPNARSDLAAIIRELGEKGCAVLVSSHILSELKEFCNAVGIMDQGVMKVSGLLDDIVANLAPQKTLQIQALGSNSGLGDFLKDMDLVHDLREENDAILFNFDGTNEDVAQLLKTLVAADYPIINFHEQQKDIQDVFMEVSG